MVECLVRPAGKATVSVVFVLKYRLSHDMMEDGVRSGRRKHTVREVPQPWQPLAAALG